MNSARPLAVVALLLSLAACGPAEPPPTQDPPPEGRAETKSIRNTSAIGYDGKGIAKSVDKALDANDQHVKQVEQQSNAGEAGDAGAPPPQD